MCSGFILDKCAHIWSYSGIFPFFNIFYSCLLYTKSLGQHQLCKLSKLFQRLLAEIIFLKYIFLKMEATSRCLVFLFIRVFGCPKSWERRQGENFVLPLLVSAYFAIIAKEIPLACSEGFVWWEQLHMGRKEGVCKLFVMVQNLIWTNMRFSHSYIFLPQIELRFLLSLINT